jgi:hypothetical protein
MADNKVIFEVVATAKGFNIVNKQQKNLRTEIDKTTNSEKNLDKQRDKGYGRQQQAVIQTANSTKNFSKLNQTIGGSSGSGALVSTYALLAANVFAATAAFSALRNAAAVEKLGEGLTAFSNQTGQSLDLVSAKLKEVTGNAVSLEQAMRTAALSTSAGFGVAEMEGLTRVAKGASLALGRDMGDALDRLTRGAIKLEPEILDELGIMVRLDDAVETYAAQLGKAASGLTRFERQQAFMNAIITEGTDKFGQIAEEINPNAYDKLSAALADLSKNMLTLLNRALIPIINFFMSSPALFLGGILAMSGGITRRLIPAIGDLTAKSKASAEQAKASAAGFLEAGGVQAQAAREAIKTVNANANAYNNLIDKYKNGSATAAELTSGKKSLTRAINLELDATKTLRQNLKAMSPERRAEFLDMLRSRKALDGLSAATKNVAATRKLAFASADIAFFQAEEEVLTEASRATLGFGDSLTKLKNVTVGVTTATKTYVVEIYKAVIAQNNGIRSSKLFAAAQAILRGSIKATTLSFKAFGTALLGAIPFIGIALVAFSFLKDAVMFVAKSVGFFSEESGKAKEATKDLNTVLDGIPEKFESLRKAEERASETTRILTQEFRVLGGVAKSAFDEAIKTQKAFADAGGLSFTQSGFGPDSRQAGAAVRTAQSLRGAGSVNPLLSSEGFVEEELQGVDAFAVSLAKLEKESDMAAKIIKNKLGTNLDDFAVTLLNTMGPDGIGRLGEITKQTLADVEKETNGIAQAADGVQTAFKEAEKEAGKFLRTFAVKSSYDGVITAMQAINTEMKGLEEQLAEASTADAAGILAEQMNAIGSNVALLGGIELGKDLDNLQKKQAEIQEERRKLNLTINEEEREQIKKNIEILQQQFNFQQRIVGQTAKQQISNRLDQLRLARENDVLIKREVKVLKSIQKGVQAVTKDGLVKIAQSQLSIDILDKEVSQLKTILTFNEETIRQAQLKLESGVARNQLTEIEQDALLQLEGTNVRLKEIEDERRRTGAETLGIRLEEIKSAQALFNQQKELNNLAIEGAKKTREISKFRLGENLDATAKDAEETLKLELQKIKFARMEAELKFAVIDAEFRLLAARAQIEGTILKEREQAALAQQMEQTRGRRTVAGGGGFEVAGTLIEQQDTISTLIADSVNLGLSDPFTEGLKSALKDIETELATVKTEGQAGRLKNLGDALVASVESGERGVGIANQILDQTLENLDSDVVIAAQNFSKNLGKNILTQVGGGSAVATALSTTTTSLMEDAIEKLKLEAGKEGISEEKKSELDTKIAAATTRLKEFRGGLGQVAETMQVLANISRSIFGEDGILISGIAQFSANFVGAFDSFSTNFEEAGTKSEKLAAKLELAGNITAAFGALSQAAGQAKVAEVDQAIEAEKKRDGKSKESLAKIAALEKKKDSMAKKAFERNKKIQMAQTIINTASAIVAVLDDVPAPYNFALAALVGAMGAAQLGMIAKTQYQSTSGGGDTATPSTALNIGSRSNSIDVSQRASGGELAYLRGGRGVGTNANNFTPGAAMGRKGYADGGEGITVGERGPEVISPAAPIDITPNYALGSGTTNVNFNISAVDGASVQNMLNEQQGNIIAMIRQAANDNGEGFLESVDPTVYGGGGG